MSAPYRLIGVLLGLISIGLGILGARSETIGLQPCGSLDVSLRLSGCLRTVDGYRAALSPDGSMLAVAGMAAPAVELRRVADGALLSTLTTGQASSLEFTPDGQTLAVGTLDAAQLWRVADGGLLHALPHTELQRAERVVDVAFSPDGTILATATTADPPMMPSPPSLPPSRSASGASPMARCCTRSTDTASGPTRYGLRRMVRRWPPCSAMARSSPGIPPPGRRGFA